jgi:hypothetical protein
MVQQALLCKDPVSAWLWSEDLIKAELEARGEKIARKMQADGKGGEILNLRHEDSEAAPYGLYNLQYTLEHDKGRFFRNKKKSTTAVASQSTVQTAASVQPAPMPFLTTSLPEQTNAQPDPSRIILLQQQQQQQQPQTGFEYGQSAAAPAQSGFAQSTTVGGGQAPQQIALEINVTGNAGRQNQYQQQQQQFGQRQFYQRPQQFHQNLFQPQPQQT